MKTSLPFLPYARQSIDEGDVAAVAEALQGEVITRGPFVKAFEDAIATYCGASYAVAFNSATSALAAACHAAGMGPHDAVISTPNTFIASLAAPLLQGATPVFIDIDKKTGNMSQSQLAANIHKERSRGRTFAIPVHFSGLPLDMKAIDDAVADPDFFVIEDAAHALGSSYPTGGKVGSCQWSSLAVFSFHPAKTITTGEGGMVTTNSEELCHKLRRFCNNGIEREPRYLQMTPPPFLGYYEVVHLGGNYHMAEAQAALGLSQMKRIDLFIEKRRELLEHYASLLRHIPHLALLQGPSPRSHQVAHHLCSVQIDFEAYNTTRSQVMEHLRERGIGTQVHYIPLYRHPFFVEKIGDLAPFFPAMEEYYEKALTLPLYYDLEKKEVERVVQTLEDALKAGIAQTGRKGSTPRRR